MLMFISSPVLDAMMKGVMALMNTFTVLMVFILLLYWVTNIKIWKD